MSDDADPQLQATITVGADVAGAQQAQDALDGVKNSAGGASDAADKTSGSMDKMGQGAMGAGHLLHGLEMAGQGSARGLFSAATGARHLLEALGAGALGGAALVIGGITAGVMALYKAFGQSKEETDALKKKTEEVLEQIEKWRSVHLDDIVNEYKRANAAIDSMLKSTELLHAAQVKLLDAKTAAKLADLDIDEALALKKVAHDDEMGRQRVTQDFAHQRVKIQDDTNVDKAFLDRRQADQNASSASSKAEENAKLMSDLRNSFEHAIEMKDRLQDEKTSNSIKMVNLSESSTRRIAEAIALLGIPGGVSEKNKIAAEYADLKSKQGAIDQKVKDLGENMVAWDKQYTTAEAAQPELDAKAAAAKMDLSAATTDFGTARARRTGDEAKGQNDDAQLAYEQKKRSDEEALRRKEEEIRKREEAIAEQERANKEHLRQAEHGEAPEDRAILNAAANNPRAPDVKASMQGLVQALKAKNDQLEREKKQAHDDLQAVKDQLDQLKSVVSSSISNN